MTCELLHPTGCGMCGKKLTGRQKKWCSKKCAWKHTSEHRWTNAKKALKAANAYYRCAHCGINTQKIEVNHIIPCKGKHGTWGCHHHSDNLELLCHQCHVNETNKQRERNWT